MNSFKKTSGFAFNFLPFLLLFLFYYCNSRRFTYEFRQEINKIFHAKTVLWKYPSSKIRNKNFSRLFQKYSQRMQLFVKLGLKFRIFYTNSCSKNLWKIEEVSNIDNKIFSCVIFHYGFFLVLNFGFIHLNSDTEFPNKEFLLF